MLWPDGVQVAESVGRRYEVLRPHLDERQLRLMLGSEAAELARGGIKIRACSKSRVRRGVCLTRR